MNCLLSIIPAGLDASTVLNALLISGVAWQIRTTIELGRQVDVLTERCGSLLDRMNRCPHCNPKRP